MKHIESIYFFLSSPQMSAQTRFEIPLYLVIWSNVACGEVRATSIVLFSENSPAFL
jgi:hypothetical protein